MNSSYPNRMLSDGHFSEYDLQVLMRRRSSGYVDEQNLQGVPPEWLEAGRVG